jgi:hypothetical protein
MKSISQLLALSPILVILGACETIPNDAFRLTESSLRMREMQTRVYASADDNSVMSASAAVLQDMGYTIDEVEYVLGVISASKRADATNRIHAVGTKTLDTMICALSLLMACNGKNYSEIDDVQDIRLTLISMPESESSDEVAVRITIQRFVWDKEGRLTEQSTVTDGKVYEAVFAKLSKAVFLEQEGV